MKLYASLCPVHGISWYVEIPNGKPQACRTIGCSESLTSLGYITTKKPEQEDKK